MTLTFSFDVDVYIEDFIESSDDEFNGYEIEKANEGYYFDGESIALSREDLFKTLYALLAYQDIVSENQRILDTGYASIDSDIRSAISERDSSIPFSTWLRTEIYPILRR